MRSARRFFSLFPDLGENPDASLEVVRRNIFYKFVAQPMGGVENFVENRFRAALEMDDFAPPVIGRRSPLDPTPLFEPVEQTGKGWLFNAHAFSDFFLGEFVSTLGKVNEGAPFALTQTEWTQALVKFGAPGTGGAEEQETELISIGRWHAGNWLAY